MSDASIPRAELAPDYSISRVLTGGWQLTPDHSSQEIHLDRVLARFTRLAEAGFTTFDCADIYTGVEELLGRFLSSWRTAGRDPDRIQIHTKYVPDLEELPNLSRADVERAVDRSLERLGVERLDLLQFHWWNYEVAGFEETAGHLADLIPKGKIRLLGLTNVDTPHLQRLVDAGIPIATNQIQYSLLDRRARHGMAVFCAERGIQLLCYGSLAGGFLTNRYLGSAAPVDPLDNRSLIKYRLIIEEFGGWGAFLQLLNSAVEIAAKHETSIAAVAARWVLEQPQVAGVILGSGRRAHIEDNLALFSWSLDDEDRARLADVFRRFPGPSGDIYGLEREPEGAHRAILRTGLHSP